MPDSNAPSKEQVEWAMSGALRRIVSGAARPRAGLRDLVAIYHSAPTADDAQFVGEEYEIAQLIGYFYDYDDLEEHPTEVSFKGQYGARGMAALDTEVVRLAKAWLDAREQAGG